VSILSSVAVHGINLTCFAFGYRISHNQLSMAAQDVKDGYLIVDSRMLEQEVV
jgi:hypothetical protein